MVKWAQWSDRDWAVGSGQWTVDSGQWTIEQTKILVDKVQYDTPPFYSSLSRSTLLVLYQIRVE